jgi:hypothetical protein
MGEAKQSAAETNKIGFSHETVVIKLGNKDWVLWKQTLTTKIIVLHLTLFY